MAADVRHPQHDPVSRRVVAYPTVGRAVHRGSRRDLEGGLGGRCVHGVVPGRGRTRAIPALGKAVTDINASVRRVAVRALARINDTRAVDALVRALQDDDAEVRRRAARALGQRGSR
ncbi:MAG: HEAT repeat domain-containing protein [Gemmatimonadetes bacterium]|nr:HEAT repeat domain-containing protein [Gemmatimonadota bacterium]